jgi:hypothetical protein
MRRIILLGGLLLVLGEMTALVARVPKPAAAEHLAGKPGHNSPASLIKPWHDLQEEIALP